MSTKPRAAIHASSGKLLKLWVLVDGDKCDEYFSIEVSRSADVLDLLRAAQSPKERIPGARPEKLTVWKFNQPVEFDPESSLLRRIQRRLNSSELVSKLTNAQLLSTIYPQKPPNGLHLWITHTAVLNPNLSTVAGGSGAAEAVTLEEETLSENRSNGSFAFPYDPDIKIIQSVEEIQPPESSGTERRGLKRACPDDASGSGPQPKRACLRSQDLQGKDASLDVFRPPDLMKVAITETQLTIRCRKLIPDAFRVAPDMFSSFKKLNGVRIMYMDERKKKVTVEIHPGLDIFVRPRQISDSGKLVDIHNNGASDEPEYWKCRVLAVRKWKEDVPRGCPEWWMQVRWFYQPDTVEDQKLILSKKRYPDRQVLNQLGNTELLFSNEECIIPIDWVVWYLGVHDFEDTFQSSASIPPREYYWRFGLDIDKKMLTGITRHCHPRCQEIYDIIEDRQRYCRSCKIWYHVKCLDSMSKEKKVKMPLRTINSLPRNVPIERGHELPDDYFDHEPNLPGEHVWQTSGNGRLIELVRSLESSGVPPDDWRGKLKQEFVTDGADDVQAEASSTIFVSKMLGQAWRWYKCIGTGCGRYI